MSMMISTTCFLVILFLVFINNSLHKCNARPLGALLVNNNIQEKYLQISSKGEEKVGKAYYKEIYKVDDPKVMESLSSKKDIQETNSGIMRKITSKKEKRKTTISRASVKWKVPKKKRGSEKQPGFNLDYSPPKTHPPSHN